MVLDFIDRVLRVFPNERVPQEDHVVKNDSQRPHVDRMVVLSVQDFWGHVKWVPRDFIQKSERLQLGRFLEIIDFDLFAVEQNVVEPQVAVHDVFPVQVNDQRHDFLENVVDADFVAQFATADPLLQIAALG